MLFYHRALSADRPPPPSYQDELGSIEDHLRGKRIDEGDYQKEVAQELGVHPDTIKNWELGHTDPALRHIPRIIDYLGYVPFETEETWGQKITAYRKITGTPRSELADRLGVDESTVFTWEADRSPPKEPDLRDGGDDLLNPRSMRCSWFIFLLCSKLIPSVHCSASLWVLSCNIGQNE